MMNIARSALMQFLSESWNILHMRRQDGDSISRASMCDVWNIVCDVMKIQVKELHGLMLESRKSGKPNKTTTLRHDERIISGEVEDDCSN